MTRELTGEVERGFQHLQTAAYAAVPDELPSLIEKLAGLQAELLLHLMVRPPSPEFIDPDAAAELLGVPRRRVLVLSNGRPRPPWAVKVGRKLIVEKFSFLHDAKAGFRARNDSENGRKPTRKRS